MQRPISIALASLLLFSATLCAQNRGVEQAKVELLDDEEAKKYSTKFEEQYDQLGLRKQVCIAFGDEEPANDPEADVAVSMRGPYFYRNLATGKEFGLLAIGFVGRFRVDFESATQTKCSFVESYTQEAKTFKSFGECYSCVLSVMNKHSKFDDDETAKKQVEQAGTGQPATRRESKSEGGDKPQPGAEGRSR